MTAADLFKLIRKRHEGNAWLVLEEVANGTGANASRHADAIAIGLYPSRGHEIHFFETKVSREDVKKELRDARKADAVGKFCDYLWLVISDEVIIDGLVIPEAWGILAPKLGVLRIVRQARKRKAVPLNRTFVAALMRNAMKRYVPRSEHDAFKATAKETVLADLKREREWSQSSLERKVDELEAKIAKFAEISGVDIQSTYHWDLGNIGDAVKLLMDARQNAKSTWRVTEDLQKALDEEASRMERTAQHHSDHAELLKETALALRDKASIITCAKRCGATFRAEPIDGTSVLLDETTAEQAGWLGLVSGWYCPCCRLPSCQH
jgi:hypothetical protein